MTVRCRYVFPQEYWMRSTMGAYIGSYYPAGAMDGYWSDVWCSDDITESPFFPATWCEYV